MNKKESVNSYPLKYTEFLRLDTKNYTALNKSLCGRAYELETKTIKANRADIEKFKKLINKENTEFENRLKEIEDEKEDTKNLLSIFSSRIKKSKTIKDETKDHNNKIMVFNTRMNRKIKQLEENRRMLQDIINKLQEKGIVWSKMKKLLEEQIRLGIFYQRSIQNSVNKNKKGITIIHSKKISRLLNDNIGSDGDSGKTFKEKNFLGLEELYRILGLTPEEFREYQIILQHIYYNREKLKDREIAIKLRMALAFDRNLKKFTNLAKFASDYALYNDIFKYFMSNNGEDYEKNYKRFLYAKIQDDRVELEKMTRFYRDQTYRLLHDSGFGMGFIEKNYPIFEAELRQLYTSPIEMRRLIERIESPGTSYKDLHNAFQDLIREEISYRIRTSNLKNINSHSTIDSQYQNDNALQRDYGEDTTYDSPYKSENSSLFDEKSNDFWHQYNFQNSQIFDDNYTNSVTTSFSDANNLQLNDNIYQAQKVDSLESNSATNLDRNFDETFNLDDIPFNDYYNLQDEKYEGLGNYYEENGETHQDTSGFDLDHESSVNDYGEKTSDIDDIQKAEIEYNSIDIDDTNALDIDDKVEHSELDYNENVYENE